MSSSWPPLLRISALARIGSVRRASRCRRPTAAHPAGLLLSFQLHPVFSFNLVVLVEGRVACGEQHFHLQSQRFRTAPTLWAAAPEARGLQTTTSARPTGLWMTVQLFEKCPQGCHGRGALLIAALQRLSERAHAVAGSPRCPWCGRRRSCAPHAAASRGRGPARRVLARAWRGRRAVPVAQFGVEALPHQVSDSPAHPGGMRRMPAPRDTPVHSSPHVAARSAMR
jgi:hypothetical protein